MDRSPTKTQEMAASLRRINSSKPIFVAQPDRYGRCGHQSFSTLTSYALAICFEGQFAPISCQHFAINFNKAVNFKNSSYAWTGARKAVRNIELFSKHGDRYLRFQTNDAAGVRELVGQIIEHLNSSDESESILFILPFDQPIGLLSRFLTREKDDLHKCLVTRFQYNVKTIAIHWRRGDCNPQKYPDWYIDEETIYEISSRLASNIQDANFKLFTQGEPPRKFIELCMRCKNFEINSAGAGFTNDAEVNDFVQISNSDIIIGGLSTYSILGALMGKKKMIVLRNSGSQLTHQLRPDCDFIFTRDAEPELKKAETTSVSSQIYNYINDIVQNK